MAEPAATNGVDDKEAQLANDAAEEEEAHTKEGYVGKVSPWWKVAYGLPGFATTSLSFLIAVYANDFYVLLGVDLSFLSFFTALARSFDVLTDPIMGWFSDKTRTRYGRRRPFMLVGCLFYALLFVALFTPPSPSEEGGDNMKAALWFGTFYTTFYLLDTFTNVPYEALGPELSDDYNERNNIFFVAKLFNFLGMMFAAAAPAGIQYVLRQAGKATLDCRDLYVLGDDPKAAPPQFFPQFLEDGQCKSMSHCEGSQGRTCFAQVSKSTDDRFLEVEFEILQQCAGRDVVLGNTTLNCHESLESRCQITHFDSSDHQCFSVENFSISNLQASQKAFFYCALIFGIYYVLSISNCVFTIRERLLKKDAAVPIPLVPSILRAFKNRAFRPLLVAWALDGLALAALVTMFPFFIRYVVASDGIKAKEAGVAMDPLVCMGISVMGLLLAAMLAAPFWLFIGQRFGKYYAWMVFNVVSVVTNLLFFIPEEGDPIQTILVMIVNGIPVGGQFLTNSVLADVIDYDEFLNGSRSEGSFSVFATLIPKFVAIPASALPLAIINILGFKAPIHGVSQPQDKLVKVFIRMTFVLLPLLSAAFGTFFKLLFPIKTQAIVKEIQDGIAKHQMTPPETKEDPITGKAVELMQLSPEESKIIWLYENFTSKCLRYLVEKQTPLPVVIEMGIYFGFGVVLTVVTLVGTAVTFRFIDQPKMSIIPIGLVILFGMSLVFALVNLMRFLDSLKLMKGDFQNHIHLIQRLSRFKMKGQRGGSLADDRPLLYEVMRRMWFTEARLETKYGNMWLNRRRKSTTEDDPGITEHLTAPLRADEQPSSDAGPSNEPGPKPPSSEPPQNSSNA